MDECSIKIAVKATYRVALLGHASSCYYCYSLWSSYDFVNSVGYGACVTENQLNNAILCMFSYQCINSDSYQYINSHHFLS